MSSPLNDITLTVRAPNDVSLPGAFPRAEYMYGCVPTAIGMLLGYYDLYGYQNISLNNLIDGDIAVNSRGLDGNAYDMDAFDTILGNFIASEGYVDRFYNQYTQSELNYTFLFDGNDVVGLNTGAWDCLADYLGTGQIWRDNQDLSTHMHYMTLNEILANDSTVGRTDGYTEVEFPFKYLTMLYGLSLYVESREYLLNPEITGTYTIDSVGGTFTFADYMAEIDAGRPVIVSIYGHAMVGYGYNADTQEIIFDDCYLHNQRMTWGGSYFYAGQDRPMQSVTIIGILPEDLDLSITPRSQASQTLLLANTLGATSFSGYLYESNSIYLSFGVQNLGSDNTAAFTVEVSLNHELATAYQVSTGVIAGQTQDLTDILLGQLTPGAYQLTVTADAYNQIEESNANNNAAGLNFLVLPDDIIFWNTGMCRVQSGQVRNNTLIRSSGGVGLLVDTGGSTNGIYLDSDTQMQVSAGGTANFTYIAQGSQFVYAGGQSHNIIALPDTQVLVKGSVTEVTLHRDSLGLVYSEGDLAGAEIYGQLQVKGTAANLTVNAEGSLIASSGASIQTVDLAGYLQAGSNAWVSDLTLRPGYTLRLDQNARLDGFLRLHTPLSNLTGNQAQYLDRYEFVLQNPMAVAYLQFSSGAIGSDAEIFLDVSAAVAGNYILLQGDLSNIGSASFSAGNDFSSGQLFLSGELLTLADGQQVSLSVSGNRLCAEVSFMPKPTNLQGSANGLSWTAVAGEDTCLVQLSNDNFNHAISLRISNTALDLQNLPSGEYQWRAAVDGQEYWTNGNNLSVPAPPTEPQIFAPAANQQPDLLFAIADGIWGENYFACHTGHSGSENGAKDWNGTMESVPLLGLNRITSVFHGSSDSNLLLLSDDGLGDAIFLDDIYSPLPQNQLPGGRLAALQEIHGGAGNDIIDISSAKYAFDSNRDLTLRGGDGDDYLWGGCQPNRLFGDCGDDHLIGGRSDDLLVGGLGNDIMNGGGGTDIFTFGGDNWGNDIIRQANSGSNIIWFADISETDLTIEVKELDVILTLNPGASITVENASLEQLDLRFGSAARQEQYDALLSLGAFADYSTTSIFAVAQTNGYITSLS